MNDTQMLKQYKAHTTTLADGSKYIALDRGLADIFMGTGWKQHSRYRRVKDGDKVIWMYVSGNRIPNRWITEHLSRGVSVQ